jgi:hypothetical protein
MLSGDAAALLDRLRASDALATAGPVDVELATEWQATGVGFAASSPQMEKRFADAVRELFLCIKPTAGGPAILNEGGVYKGCWLESTGSINAELLSRFLPSVAEATFAAFAVHQRDDGLLPYKITADGAAFAQIQMVTPLARSVWTHIQLNGASDAFGLRMYEAMARHDEWLATWRDTRGTGGVEAFCCYDTGHDLSPRFWHAPDTPKGNDPKACPASPILPFVAPDLTANVACQRRYLARLAVALGQGGTTRWYAKASASERALFAQCWDEADGIFYDRNHGGEFVRVQSDVLLRVLACEIGDDAFFDAALRRFLLSTRKFFAKYPFTSIALDDPRFDPNFGHNSWAGPTNFLSLIRAPHAFEAHHRHVELTSAMQPTLSALLKGTRFPQTLDPFTGREGFTESYSPAILCLLDFIERLSGIMPRPDGTLWFTGLTPAQIEHRDEVHETAYRRIVDGVRFEIVNAGGETVALRDGQLLYRAPAGVRVVTDRDGTIRSLIGMRSDDVAGTLTLRQGSIPFSIAPNEQLDLRAGELSCVRKPGLVPPTT